MDLGLDGRVALVTGASKGIGKAIAAALAAEGCRVVLCARGREDLEAAEREITASGGEAHAVAADVSDAKEVERLVEETKSHYGSVEILVNNAGSIGRPGSFEELSDEEWTELLNLTKSLSKAYGPDGILVNTVSPATIRTPLVEGMFEEMANEQGISSKEAEEQFLRETRPHIVLGRPGEPEEAAAAVVFLAFEAASFITGSNYRVDGGSVASQ